MYIKNLNKYCDVKDGESILDVLIREEINLPFSCNGYGICGKCKVNVLDEENHANLDNYSLACKTIAKKDMRIYLPESYIEVDRESKLSNNIFNKDKILEKRNKNSILRLRRLGVAFDIGTTTVVGMLWDLDKGIVLSKKAKGNSQSLYGADIISRAQYASLSEDNSILLQKKVIDDCNEILNNMCREEKKYILNGRIEKIFMVGNTIISHLLLRKNTKQLIRYPFEASFKGYAEVESEALGIHLVKNKECKILDGTKVMILPNLGGQVGSDILAGMIAIDLKSQEGNILFIDVGTNGEIVLKKEDQMVTCSTAAGPAFEGASIFCGMRAVEGAIEGVKIENDNIHCAVIGNRKPIGICGSGIIDIIAELINVGIVDNTGRMFTKEEAKQVGINIKLADRIILGKQGPAFILSSLNGKVEEDIIITQKDIREIQLAKAAIYAGTKTLMDKMNVSKECIEKIYLAGAFGNYINIKNAMAIGLLPKIDANKITQVGNAAVDGVSMVMLNENLFKEACELPEKVGHIELTLEKEFQNLYIGAMNF